MRRVSFTQVMNNVERAEAYLKRADEVEEATTTATAADGSGRLTLMGRSEPCDGSKETVSAALNSGTLARVACWPCPQSALNPFYLLPIMSACRAAWCS